jgi:uncharacterized membrane protein YkvA (DUF1232 family)
VNSLAARLARVVALLKDPRTPRLPKLMLLGACLYLLTPIDLVPEFFMPVAGFLDDAMFLWLALRNLLKSGPTATGTTPSHD